MRVHGFFVDSQRAIQAALGVTFAVEGSQLTVRFRDGRTEHWREVLDAIGLDPDRPMITLGNRVYVPLEAQ